MEPPLLMPIVDLQEDSRNHATFIDRCGDLVNLPNNLLVPFARMAARMGIKRIKRFHITNAYRPRYVLMFRFSWKQELMVVHIVRSQATQRRRRRLYLTSSPKISCQVQ
jgi:hypothetical protein